MAADFNFETGTLTIRRAGTYRISLQGIGSEVAMTASYNIAQGLNRFIPLFFVHDSFSFIICNLNHLQLKTNSMNLLNITMREK